MFNDSYIAQPRGIAAVGFYAEKEPKQLEKDGGIFTHAHYHGDVEMLYIKHGKGEFWISGQRYSFDSGAVFLINPYELHYGMVQSGQRLCYYCIDFDMGVLLRREKDFLLEEYMAGRRRFCSYCQEVPSVAGHIVAFCTAFEKNEPAWVLKAVGELYLLLAEIEQMGLALALGEHVDGGFAAEVYQFIRQNYQFDITSKEAAEYFQYNSSYFCRLFKKNFGVKFQVYLNTFRIRRAGILIENGKRTVSEIAAESGFNHASYFAQVFKKLMGMTPTEYMELCEERRKNPGFDD